MSALSTVPLASLAARLAAEPLYGAFARHLLRVVPDVAVPVVGVRPDAFAIGGRAHGRFEVGFGWLFGDDVDAVARLVEGLAEEGAALQLYAPVRLGAELAARRRGLALARDLLLVCEVLTPVDRGAEVVALDAETPRGRMHPAIAERLPPPQIWSRFDFAYRGLVDDGSVVAVLETTVDDGQHVAIQQVFTAPDRRGQGLGKQLVARVCGELLAGGRRPLWVCASDNVASIALARAVGFVERMRLAVLECPGRIGSEVPGQGL